MNRTFHHRLSWTSYAGMAVLAVASLCSLWNPGRPGSIVVGLLLAMTTAVAVERMLHTCYVFEGSLLHISRGRFARRRVVDVAHVRSATVVSLPLGLRRYVLLQMDDGRELAFQPDGERAFVDEIEKRRNA